MTSPHRPSHRGLGLSLNADLIDGDMPTLERHLGLVADAGAEWVELILHGLDVVVAGRLQPARMAAVTRILDRFEVGRTLHLPYDLNLLSPHQAEGCRSVFAAGLEFAAETGVAAVTYHSSFVDQSAEAQASAFYERFGTDPLGQYAALLDYDRETLGALAAAAPAGTVIGVENTAWNDPRSRRGYGSDARDVAAHVAGIGASNLGMTLDFGHLHMTSTAAGRDIVDEVDAVLPQVVHIHAHDNFGDSTPTARYMDALPYGYGDLHLPVGWGSIPWDRLLPGLADYRGVWMMEIEFRLSPHFSDIVRDMRDRFAALSA